MKDNLKIAAIYAVVIVISVPVGLWMHKVFYSWLLGGC